jgi:hypothetical protein
MFGNAFPVLERDVPVVALICLIAGGYGSLMQLAGQGWRPCDGLLTLKVDFRCAGTDGLSGGWNRDGKQGCGARREFPPA